MNKARGVFLAINYLCSMQIDDHKPWKCKTLEKLRQIFLRLGKQIKDFVARIYDILSE